jgi:hypothetical protein
MTAPCLVSSGRRTFQTTTDYRQLATPELFDRLVGRIIKDEDVEQDLAERIMESALGFLWLSATRPGMTLSPSPLVDIGWHKFILYTRGYGEFCERVAGRFIHHEPNDNPNARQRPGGIKRTIAAFDEAGLPLDDMIWTGRLTRKKTLALLGDALPPGDCTVDCDDGGGGPGDECSCS